MTAPPYRVPALFSQRAAANTLVFLDRVIEDKDELHPSAVPHPSCETAPYHHSFRQQIRIEKFEQVVLGLQFPEAFRVGCLHALRFDEFQGTHNGPPG